MNGNSIARLREVLGVGKSGSANIGTVLSYDQITQTVKISVGGEQVLSRDARTWAAGARVIVGSGGAIIGPVPDTGITLWID